MPKIISISAPGVRESFVLPESVKERLRNVLADVLERECGEGHVTGSRAPECAACHRHRVRVEMEGANANAD